MELFYTLITEHWHTFYNIQKHMLRHVTAWVLVELARVFLLPGVVGGAVTDVSIGTLRRSTVGPQTAPQLFMLSAQDPVWILSGSVWSRWQEIRLFVFMPSVRPQKKSFHFRFESQHLTEPQPEWDTASLSSQEEKFNLLFYFILVCLCCLCTCVRSLQKNRATSRAGHFLGSTPHIRDFL